MLTLWKAWRRAILEKKILPQLGIKFSTFIEIQIFITMFTRIHHILSQIHPVHTTPSYLIKVHLYYNPIYVQAFQSAHAPVSFHQDNPVSLTLLPRTLDMPFPSHPSSFQPNNTCCVCWRQTNYQWLSNVYRMFIAVAWFNCKRKPAW